VAHASVSGNIVDPDIPADRKRIGADLDIIAALANRYIKIDAGVPDEMDLYATRDRTAPWHALMTPAAVAALKGGGHIEKPGYGQVRRRDSLRPVVARSASQAV
jgi:hypothetical protein